MAYPEEPLAPLPDPDESGKITLPFSMAYWLEPTYPVRDPYNQLIGPTYAVSAPYRYKQTIFQAFLASVSTQWLVTQWNESGPLNLPATWDDARARSGGGISTGLVRDWYHTADLVAQGWRSFNPIEFPDLIFQAEIAEPFPYRCLYLPYDDGTGFYYYAIVGNIAYNTGYNNLAYWYCLSGGIRCPSLLPLLAPFLLLPLLPLPFLLPLAPLMGMLGIGEPGAYGAGSSANNSAGRRRKKTS
jgi:hypothetical protein